MPDFISRRNFLSKTTLASAASLAGVMSARAADTKTEPLKVGFVGLGGRGSGAVYDAMNADPGTVIWAIAEVDEPVLESRSREYKEKFGDRAQFTDRAFSGFDGCQKVIDSGIDVLVLATPPAFRPAHIQAGLEAGKHVFAEKPWCVDAMGLHQVTEAVRAGNKKGLSFMTGLVWRHTAEAQTLYNLVNDGAIGKVLNASGYYVTTPPPIVLDTDKMPHLQDYVTRKRWFGFVELGGDWVLEQFIHSVDKLGWAMGDVAPSRVYGTGGAHAGHKGANVFDHFNLTYEFDGGGRAYLHGSHCGKYSTIHDEVFGTKGRTYLSHGRSQAEVDGEVVAKSGPPRLGYVDEHKTFYAAIRKGELYTDIDAAYNTHLMGLMGRYAAYTGNEIFPEDVEESEEQLFDSFAKLDGSSTFTPRAMANPFTSELD